MNFRKWFQIFNSPPAPMRTKKVISFSLWGTLPMYLEGAKKNLQLQKEIFPDWVCRFYVDQSVPAMVIEALRANGAEIKLKEPNRKTSGSFWRFEAFFDDPEIRVVIMRDCDSRLSWREKEAVDEWLASDMPFHVMRDHPHHTHPMMAGMWGARIDLIQPSFIREYQKYYQKYFKKSSHEFWCDTEFLTEKIWKKIIPMHLAHVSFDSLKITGKEKPFSSELPDSWSFIGNKYDENDKPAYSISAE